jgi:hypothetical protein
MNLYVPLDRGSGSGRKRPYTIGGPADAEATRRTYPYTFLVIGLLTAMGGTRACPLPIQTLLSIGYGPCHWANRAGNLHNLGPWGKLATSAWKDDLPIPLMFRTFRKDASVRTKRRYAVVSQSLSIVAFALLVLTCVASVALG